MARKSPNRGGTAQLTAPAEQDADPATDETSTTTDATSTATDATSTATRDTETEASGNYYPGKRFGLPERGPGSVSSMPRRVVALFIDWLLSMVIAYWLTHSQFWTIAVFAVEVYVLTALTGCTVGKRLVGIRAIRIGGGQIGFGWALVRTAILLTVVPPLLTDRDLRGLHDRASDTIVVCI